MVVLLCGWLGMTYLGVDGISNGNPNLLVNGIDYDGRICGVDEAVKDKSKVTGNLILHRLGVCIGSLRETTTVVRFNFLRRSLHA